jgi:hypothetical protein
MFKKETRGAVIALILLSVGGWIIHGRAHPVSFDAANPSHPAFLIPFMFGILNVVVTPMLLSFARTMIVGYLINGIAVIVGTLSMGALSASHLPSPLTLPSVFMKTTLSDIILLFPKLFLGQMVLLHYHPHGMGRMFTPFWWLRHFFYLGIFFTLGYVAWR